MSKKIIYFLVLVGLFCSVSFVFAQIKIQNPLGDTDNFKKLLIKIADGVGILIASLGAIMIIVAGILYLTSAGSAERMGTAKKALIYAIAGIAIGIAARPITETIVDILK